MRIQPGTAAGHATLAAKSLSPINRNMKIVVAPQGFKEGLVGIEVAHAIAVGVRRVWEHAEITLLPVADGGDGTLQSLVDATDGELVKTEVDDPLGRPIVAEWGALGDGTTAVIEMARSSGLALLKPEERDPLITTTYGVGQLMLEAVRRGYRKLIIGIGGSATNDGGAGMAQAIGAKLLDAKGNEISRGGAALLGIDRIDISGIDRAVAESEIEVACDVNNPLCGSTGASEIFGPQKGATREMIDSLDGALLRFSRIIARDIGRDVADTPGAGAAGGLGAGLMAFTNATLRPGADIVMDALGVAERLQGASLVIVGEGQIDRSTTFNKAPVAVATLAKSHSIPTIAVAGGLGEGWHEVHEHGISAAFAIENRPMTLQTAMADAADLIADTAEEACRAVAVAMDAD